MLFFSYRRSAPCQVCAAPSQLSASARRYEAVPLWLFIASNVFPLLLTSDAIKEKEKNKEGYNKESDASPARTHPDSSTSFPKIRLLSQPSLLLVLAALGVQPPGRAPLISRPAPNSSPRLFGSAACPALPVSAAWSFSRAPACRALVSQAAGQLPRPRRRSQPCAHGRCRLLRTSSSSANRGASLESCICAVKAGTGASSRGTWVPCF